MICRTTIIAIPDTTRYECEVMRVRVARPEVSIVNSCMNATHNPDVSREVFCKGGIIDGGSDSLLMQSGVNVSFL